MALGLRLGMERLISGMMIGGMKGSFVMQFLQWTFMMSILEFVIYGLTPGNFNIYILCYPGIFVNLLFPLNSICLRRNVLPTRELLSRRHVSSIGMCPLCSQEPESGFHCLRDCHVVRPTWIQLGMLTEIDFWQTTYLSEWVRLHTHKFGNVFLVALWEIWLNRNRACFQGLAERLTNLLPIIWANSSCISRVLGDHQPLTQQACSWICWEKPPEGVASLNVDGSSIGNRRAAGFGGVLRDSSGSWLHGFLWQHWVFRDSTGRVVSYCSRAAHSLERGI
ncbi:Reverse transcriptase zinc-binding domain [Sesbania bispinosa]|nr:Reverse transcriptase zinc-binding domain [Sesbania bispinosa]